jgi:hypothetical protein
MFVHTYCVYPSFISTRYSKPNWRAIRDSDVSIYFHKGKGIFFPNIQFIKIERVFEWLQQVKFWLLKFF